MTATIQINPDFNGIELYFNSKPESAIIDLLKANRWRWHNVKKCWYAKQSEATMALAQTIANGAAEAVTLPTTAENVHGVKVGQIYYTSWGYDQTNIDFFEVVAVTKSMATVRPIQSRRTDTEYMQGVAEPVPGAYITDSNFYKPETKTRTDNYGRDNDKPILKNADGYKHQGYLYTGGTISYSSYA